VVELYETNLRLGDSLFRGVSLFKKMQHALLCALLFYYLSSLIYLLSVLDFIV